MLGKKIVFTFLPQLSTTTGLGLTEKGEDEEHVFGTVIIIMDGLIKVRSRLFKFYKKYNEIYITD